MVCRNIPCQLWGFTEARKVQIRHVYLQTNLDPYIFALTFWDDGFPGCIWCQWWADDSVIICTLNVMHLIISVRLPHSRTSGKDTVKIDGRDWQGCIWCSLIHAIQIITSILICSNTLPVGQNTTEFTVEKGRERGCHVTYFLLFWPCDITVLVILNKLSIKLFQSRVGETLGSMSMWVGHELGILFK